jgi:methylmalonyl-CoA mutase C-terminal domain/subunit
MQEDVDVIGISILSGAHKSVCRKVLGGLQQKKMDDVKLVVGGIVPPADVDYLQQLGVAAVFVPGTPLSKITNFVKLSCGREKAMTV